MNGPSSPPLPSNPQKGGPMAKKKIEQASASSWTPGEEEIAKRFMEYLKLEAGSYPQRKVRAASKMQYQNGYDSIPDGVKACISHLENVAKKQKADTKYMLDLQNRNAELEKSHAAQMKDRQWAQANTHPDDIDRVMAELEEQ